jgi:hypothetical protein
MEQTLSPKYKMKLIKEVNQAIWDEFKSYKEVGFYVENWHDTQDDWNNHWENFNIRIKENGDIDLLATLHNIEDKILLQMAIDIGVETPDFIPSIPLFRNAIKSDYKTASATFEKAFKQIEEHPDTAIGLANSALESIIKEILKDERINSKIKGTETLYDLAKVIFKEFQFSSNADLPMEIKTIGTSMLAINQSIEKLRSEKTNFHGKTKDDYVIQDSLYTYFIVNTVTTIGLFLNSYFKNKFPKPEIEEDIDDGLPF